MQLEEEEEEKEGEEEKDGRGDEGGILECLFQSSQDPVPLR